MWNFSSVNHTSNVQMGCISKSLFVQREAPTLKAENPIQHSSPRSRANKQSSRIPPKLVLEDTAKLAEGNRATVILAFGAL